MVGRETGEKYVDTSQRKTDSFNHVFSFPIYFSSSHSEFFDSTEEFIMFTLKFLVVIIPVCYFPPYTYLPNPFYGFYSFFKNKNFVKFPGLPHGELEQPVALRNSNAFSSCLDGKIFLSWLERFFS